MLQPIMIKDSLLLDSMEGSDPPVLAKSLIFGDGGLWGSLCNDRKCDCVSRSVYRSLVKLPLRCLPKFCA